MTDRLRCAVCAGELDQHARFCSACGTPTPTGEHPVPGAGASDAPGEFEARLRKALGDEYQLLELIGEGGFARVFKARDVRLDRLVAIKVIRPDYAGAKTFVDRFRREGVALAKLRHPGIVPIYDIRERDELIYYVMPFVEGKTLRARLDQSRSIPPHEAHRIFNELCDAIAAAHRVGIVHRDIKPDNVILEGNLGNVLLMDFGIAKAVSEENQTLTASGVLVGTPRYMSPEQASGAEVDQRSDIYSLGVLAYEMVTGHLPFDGENTQELIAQHLTAEPRPVRRINPSIPKGLAEVITRCLAKDPAQRFRDAAELSSRLQEVRIFEPPVEHAATGSPGPQGRPMALMFAFGVIVALIVVNIAPRFASPPPVPDMPAIDFARSWLGLVRAADGDTPDDSVLGRLLEALAPDPEIRFVAIDPIHPPTVTTLRPDRLTSREDLMDMLSRVRPEDLSSYAVGEVSLVTADLGGEDVAGCGTVGLTLQARLDEWKITRVEAVDFGALCPDST